MPSRRRLLTAVGAVGSAALAGCNAGVFEPRIRTVVSATATIPPGEHRAWRFGLAREREGRLGLDEHGGDARMTTLTPTQYDAYVADEPVPDADREAVELWHDDGAYVTHSEIDAGEWVLVCENVSEGPSEVTVRVVVYVWAVDLRA
jgi:hypothetical protein